MNLNNLELILSNEEIQQKNKEIAKLINDKYKDKTPVIVGIMKGSVYFLADITRYLTIPAEIDIMCLSSYGNKAESSGKVKILKDLSIDIDGRDVIILEDIIDTGTTLKYLSNYFKNQNATSVTLMSIFAKEHTNIDHSFLDVVGFVLPNDFLVGYGLDCKNQYRHLPHVYKVLDTKKI